MAETKPEELMDDPLVVELLTIFWGLQLCVSLGISKLIVESDSLLAIRVVHEVDESYVHHTIFFFSIYLD